MIIGEQLVIFGNVDFPPTDQNMVNVISALSPMGYMPSTVQELNPNDGSSNIRLVLGNLKDTQILFGLNKIQISRTEPPHLPSSGNFINFALGILEKINTFRTFNLNRVCVIRDRFLSEASEPEMNVAYGKIIKIQSDPVPFEWALRTTQKEPIGKESGVVITETSRSQGTINNNGILTQFDRLRLKIEAGTEIDNSNMRYAFTDLRLLAHQLDSKVNESSESVERLLYEL